MNQKKRAFSLVELSIVLLIVGIATSMAFSFINRGLKQKEQDTTEQRMDTIEKAILRFVQSQERLPCPASNTLTESNANFGIEARINNGPATLDTCTGTLGSGNIQAGGVPVTTLGLPTDYAYDGWNRKFTYVIDQTYANSTTTYTPCNTATPTCFHYGAGGGIEVKSSYEIVGAPTLTTSAIYTLISFGENGNGAYRKSGNALGTSVDTDELENSHFTGGGPFDNQFVQKNRDDGFDDLLRYREKSAIIQLTKTVFDESVCLLAENVIQTGSGHACQGLAGANLTNCTAIANRVRRACAGYYN